MCEIPHMEASQLEAFLEQNYSRYDCLRERIKRKRKSKERELLPVVEISSVSAQHSSSVQSPFGEEFRKYCSYFQDHPEVPVPPTHVVVLGDEIPGKLSTLKEYFHVMQYPCIGGEPFSSTVPFFSLEAGVTVPQTGSPIILFAPFVPQSDSVFSTGLHKDVHQWLRAELIQSSQCVVIFFSIKDRKSLHRAKDIYAAEVARVTKDMKETAGSLGSAVPNIPIVLVGADAECRNSVIDKPVISNGNGDAYGNEHVSSTIISSEEAVKVAQSIRASKYVEVFTGNSTHSTELFIQALRVSLPANASPGQVAARAALHDYLYSPTPNGYFDMDRVGFVINMDHFTLGPTLTSNGVNYNGGNDEEDHIPTIVLATLDGTDPRVSCTAFEVKDSFVHFFQGNSNDRSTSIHNNSKVLRLCSKSRCFFPSPVFDIRLPPRVGNPMGYFNIHNKTLILLPPLQCPQKMTENGHIDNTTFNQSNHHNLLEGCSIGTGNMTTIRHRGDASNHVSEVVVRYTIDGSEPTEASVKYTHPIPLDDSQAAYYITGNSIRGPSDANGNDISIRGPDQCPKLTDMTPFAILERKEFDTTAIKDRTKISLINSSMNDTNGPLPPSIKLIRVAAFHEGCFRSPIVDFTTPDRLPPPTVHFNEIDRTLCITPSTPNPFVEYRYTLNGSVPTQESILYTRPVVVSHRSSDEQHLYSMIRVAAFPKLFFPSEETTIDVSGYVKKMINNNSGVVPSTNHMSGVAGDPQQGTKPHQSDRGKVSPAHRDNKIKNEDDCRVSNQARTRMHQRGSPSSATNRTHSVLAVSANKAVIYRTEATVQKKAQLDEVEAIERYSREKHTFLRKSWKGLAGTESPKGPHYRAKVGSPVTPRTGVVHRPAELIEGNLPSKRSMSGHPKPRVQPERGSRNGTPTQQGSRNRSMYNSPVNVQGARSVKPSTPEMKQKCHKSPIRCISNLSRLNAPNPDLGESAFYQARGSCPIPTPLSPRGAPSNDPEIQNEDVRKVKIVVKNKDQNEMNIARDFTVSVRQTNENDTIPKVCSSNSNHKKIVLTEGEIRNTSPRPKPVCEADNNRIVFDFPDPIILSHITISTPGRGKGPDSYEVLMLPSSMEGSNHPNGITNSESPLSYISVGIGDLEDIEGVQTMHVVSSARNIPLRKVVCVLTGPDGFTVVDMKIHGKTIVRLKKMESRDIYCAHIVNDRIYSITSVLY